MSPDTPPTDRHSRGRVAIITLVVLCLGTEVILLLADAGVFGSSRLRSIAYEYGGFWPGLWRDWGPNFALQPWVMFVTYGFLHAGLWHLILNMVTLVSLGLPVAHRVGGARLVALYFLSMIGGGIGQALLTQAANEHIPIVGASGALFGLAGAVLAWEYVDRFTLKERLWPVARAVLLLIGLNVALYYAMNRHLAWEAHLGGFVMGWVAALLIDPRSRGEPMSGPDDDPRP